ncbi:MAG: hypothetical protein U0894_08970 [Pirellulales bacterium]
MAFKPPGGELTFWSIVWIGFGAFALYNAAINNHQAFYLFAALVTLPAIGMWFEQRWCGYLFAALLALTLPLALWALIAIDDTLSERAYRLIRIATTSYFIYLAFRWAQDDDSTN